MLVEQEKVGKTYLIFKPTGNAEMSEHMYVQVCVCLCACMCVCVCQSWEYAAQRLQQVKTHGSFYILCLCMLVRWY